jgi:hypothetical protein
MSDPAPVAARPVPERSDTTTTTSTDSGSDTPTTVYGLIHGLAATVVDAIDAPLDWDALLSPSVSYTVIRPIVQRFAPKFGGKEEDAGPSLGAVLFALMANR